MGRYSAIDSGEPAEVARAISEHYRPRSADDALPESLPGTAVAVADRLDSLAGLFAAGLAPTGTRDPFALRRAALGLIQILLGRGIAFDLREGIRLAASLQPIPVSDAVQSQAAEFIAGRLRGLLADLGFRYDVVDAVLAAQAGNPILARRAAEELTAWVGKPGWPQILAAYARCVRITRDLKEQYAVEESLLATGEEQAIWNDAKRLREYVETEKNKGTLTIGGLLDQFSLSVGTISTFFEKILVMTDDLAVRKNRLAILQTVARLPEGLADLSKLEGF
jgi:glycyl-tRNA synthetase